MLRKETRKGVTLIELLIVVLILAALSAIAIPRISISANNAKARACQTNVDVLNSMIEVYNADEGNYPATLATLTGDTNYFPDDAPTCEFSDPYVMNGTTYRVATHGH